MKFRQTLQLVLIAKKYWPRKADFDSYLPNPNCCSRRMPMKTRLSMFARRWIIPACNQIQVISLHPWCLSTTLVHSRAPNLSSLCKFKKQKEQASINYIMFLLPSLAFLNASDNDEPRNNSFQQDNFSDTNIKYPLIITHKKNIFSVRNVGEKPISSDPWNFHQWSLESTIKIYSIWDQ